MTQTTNFLRRDPAEVTPWTETCGEIRCLIEEKDDAGHMITVAVDAAKKSFAVTNGRTKETRSFAIR